MNNKFDKFPMGDEEGNWIYHEHSVMVILHCEKCGCDEREVVDFSNHIPDPLLSFEYEFGEVGTQKGKYLWMCDCGGSMYVEEILEIIY